MTSNIKVIARPISFFFLVSALVLSKVSLCQQSNPIGKTIEVGVARVDITPTTPIRLAGYGNRSKAESDVIIHRLKAEALAFGNSD